MIRDITIGQYYPAESVIHRLDPRVKLIAISLWIYRSCNISVISNSVIKGSFWIHHSWTKSSSSFTAIYIVF